MSEKSVNLNTEANKVDKIIISYLTKIGLSNKDFDTNFTISGKDRPDVVIKDKFGKYCIIFENKKDFKDLHGAKNQGLKYLEQLKNLNLLSDKILLIRTNMSTFHADEYEIVENEIIWKKDIANIDIIEDIKIDLIKKYTHPQKQEEEKLLNTDKQELKKAFDNINNFLRDGGLGKDQRLHITMAMLFLKLIKENDDLLYSIEQGDNKKDLVDEILNIKLNVTEKNIINVFNAVNKVYNKEFHFDLEQYKNKEILTGLFKIIDEINLSNYDLDIKGEAFEYFINYGSANSDMGEYFTPRHIVRFMVNLLDEEFEKNRKGLFGKTYFDPTCGTGGFLIEIFKEIKKELKINKNLTNENIKFLKESSVFGNELNLRSSEIAKMNMILTGDGHSNINQGDFIKVKEERKLKYDVSIGNPPFGNNREWEFVDGFLKDVKIGGYSIVLVPEGVLFKADKNFVEIRRTLLNKGKLLKVISLPQGVFFPYAGVKTDIIFWKNEIQDKDYDIEFIDIKNDGFSLDANRRKLQSSDLDEYFENKQSLIDKGQIWTVNSVRIYDKTKLNELELSKSKLELEEKELKNKIETLKKQIKQIEDKIEKEQKEKRILELQSSFYELKKQIKKVNDKLKTFDINLAINRYKIQKEINKNIDYALFGDLVEYLPKSKRNASDGKETGKYPFFTSSETQDKYIDEADYIEECLIIGTGGKACIHISKEFSTSTDNFIISAIKEKLSTKYIYYLLKYNLSILEAGFKGAGLKHISKEFINNIQIPLPSLEYQQEIIKQIEEYEKIIFSAKNILEIYKPEIEIKKDWEIVNLGDVCDVRDGTHDSPEYVQEGFPLITSKNIIDDTIDFSNVNFISKTDLDNINKRSLVENGDIIMPMIGTIGDPIIVKKECEFAIKNVALIKFVGNKLINNFFVKYILSSKLFYEYIEEFSRGGTQKFISLANIRGFKIPLPSLEEQQEIIKNLEKEQKLIDVNKEIIELFENKIKKVIKKIWFGE